VDVRVKTAVSEITPGRVYLKEKDPIPAETVVWTAGHRGHPLAEASGIPTNRRGQVIVQPTLQVPGYPNVYVVGDLASIVQDGAPVPMVAPAAMQQGEQAARNILRQIAEREPEPFIYRDPGMMVVVGRNAAVANIGKRSFTGFPAWVLWLGVHLVKLIGFRNRLQVLLNWGWDYIFYERAVRLILPIEGSTLSQSNDETDLKERARAGPGR
jgi:NADH dehydrogenase